MKVDRPDNSKSQTLLDSRAPRNRVFSRIVGYSRLQPQKPGFFDFVAPTTQKGISSDLTLILVDKLQVDVYGEFASCKARSLQNVENCIVFFDMRLVSVSQMGDRRREGDRQNPDFLVGVRRLL